MRATDRRKHGVAVRHVFDDAMRVIYSVIALSVIYSTQCKLVKKLIRRQSGEDDQNRENPQ